MSARSLLNIGMINISAMTIMTMIAICSHGMKRRQKFSFSLVFVTIAVAVFTEVVSVYVDGGKPSLRWLNYLCNIIGLFLAPMIPILLSGAMSGYRRGKPLLIGMGFYLVLLILSAFTPIIFTVTSDNVYARAENYWIYVVVYGISLVRLVRETLHLRANYQNSNPLILAILILYVVIGTSIQAFIPYAYMSWSCISFVGIIYYIYCNELWLQVDGLTGLLNHGSYLRRVMDTRKGWTLIIFDVDNFKQVNDSYGHLFGDDCLRQIAGAIRTVYGSSGYCYRIGGDEFAVLVKKKHFPARDKEQKFHHFIREMRKALPGMPDVSQGDAVFRPGMSIPEFVNEADRNMYCQKHSKDPVSDESEY